MRMGNGHNPLITPSNVGPLRSSAWNRVIHEAVIEGRIGPGIFSFFDANKLIDSCVAEYALRAKISLRRGFLRQYKCTPSNSCRQMKSIKMVIEVRKASRRVREQASKAAGANEGWFVRANKVGVAKPNVGSAS